jgi:hypothetical protein
MVETLLSLTCAMLPLCESTVDIHTAHHTDMTLHASRGTLFMPMCSETIIIIEGAKGNSGGAFASRNSVAEWRWRVHSRSSSSQQQWSDVRFA